MLGVKDIKEDKTDLLTPWLSDMLVEEAD
jgi:hypothetical protein